MEKKTTFKISNLTRKTPDFWRRLGTAFLAVAAGAPAVINQFTFNPDLKSNLIAIVGLIGLAAKFATQFAAKDL